MTKTLLLMGSLVCIGAGAALAQAPPPPPAGAPAPPDTGTATNQTYRMKDGGMYQPPAQRPASPAMDRSIYGRT